MWFLLYLWPTDRQPSSPPSPNWVTSVKALTHSHTQISLVYLESILYSIGNFCWSTHSHTQISFLVYLESTLYPESRLLSPTQKRQKERRDIIMVTPLRVGRWMFHLTLKEVGKRTLPLLLCLLLLLLLMFICLGLLQTFGLWVYHGQNTFPNYHQCFAFLDGGEFFCNLVNFFPENKRKKNTHAHTQTHKILDFKENFPSFFKIK